MDDTDGGEGPATPVADRHLGQRIAVIGSGVSGLTAAYLLRDVHRVTVFESEARLGGHAHTHDVVSGQETFGVDSGFIVHNDRTYPYLRRLFAELEVDVHPTEMSMSIRCERTGLEYAGGRGVKGIFAQRRRAADPRFLGLLLQIKRFQRLAARLLATPDDAPDTVTFGEFLDSNGFSDYFVSYYAIPVVSCVWSSGQDVALDYPARYLFEFLQHHGFLQVKGSPQWFTVEGGSRTYVERVAKAIGDVRAQVAVTSVARTGEGVLVEDEHGESHHFDKVVIATHADDALALLADPTTDERRVLGAFAYSQNETALHRDPSLLPAAEQARSAWNYQTDGGTRSPRTVVTYWMNKLQGLQGTDQFLVTLNATDRIDPALVIATMEYTHPLYTRASVSAQRELPTLTTAQTAYAGAYHGWGFHEDGCRSGVQAAQAFGARW